MFAVRFTLDARQTSVFAVRSQTGACQSFFTNGRNTKPLVPFTDVNLCHALKENARQRHNVCRAFVLGARQKHAFAVCSLLANHKEFSKNVFSYLLYNFPSQVYYFALYISIM
jgi:hypothetical protein